jgi:hypothetical protein
MTDLVLTAIAALDRADADSRRLIISLVDALLDQRAEYRAMRTVLSVALEQLHQADKTIARLRAQQFERRRAAQRKAA